MVFEWIIMLIVIRYKVLDGSWYMPTEKKDPLQEYQV